MVITTEVDMFALNRKRNEKKFQKSLGNCERDPSLSGAHVLIGLPDHRPACQVTTTVEGPTGRDNVRKKNLKLGACSVSHCYLFPLLPGIDFHLGRKKLRQCRSSARATLPVQEEKHQNDSAPVL